MKSRKNVASRPVTAAEVGAWFGKSRRAALRPSQYDEIATRLTKMRWPGDATELENAPSDTEFEADRWWDFQGASKAVNELLGSLPKMLNHWSGAPWDPKSHEGFEAIEALGPALLAVKQYIDEPFGPPSRQSAGHKKQKDWHLPAVLIARLIIQAMTDPLSGTSSQSPLFDSAKRPFHWKTRETFRSN